MSQANQASQSNIMPYPDYKDSDVPWLGEIPSHWKVKKKKHLFFFSRGLNITKANLEDTGIPCVNYGEVHSKYGFEVNPKIHPLKYVSESYLESHPFALLKKGDFVYADTSEDYEGSGNFTYLNSDIPTFAGYHTVVERKYTVMNQDSLHMYLILKALEIKYKIWLVVLRFLVLHKVY